MAAYAEVVGRLTRDPELNQAGGHPVVNFSLATNRKFKKDETDFFDVTAWRELANLIASWKKQGDQVYVRGLLETRSWEKDGQKRTKTVIVADTVEFLASKGDGNSNNGSGQKATASVGASEDDIPF